MSYIVHYHRPKAMGTYWLRWLLTSGFFLTFVCITVKYWPDGREVLLSILLPEGSNVTETFISDMVNEVSFLEMIADHLSRLIPITK